MTKDENLENNIPPQELGQSPDTAPNTDEQKTETVKDSIGTKFNPKIHADPKQLTKTGRFKKLQKSKKVGSNNEVTGQAIIELIHKVCDVYIADDKKAIKPIKFIDDLFISIFDDYADGDNIIEKIGSKFGKYSLFLIPIYYFSVASVRNQSRTEKIFNNFAGFFGKIKIKSFYQKLKDKIKGSKNEFKNRGHIL